MLHVSKVFLPNILHKSCFPRMKARFGTGPNAFLKQDCFEEYFQQHHIPINYFQKLLLTVGSATVALVNPYRADMVACLGETTGAFALTYMLSKMENSEEGLKILSERPRINTDTIDVAKLRQFPENTLGKVYVNFLDNNRVTPDSRDPVKFIDDIQLAYVIQRYREIHDFVHAILGMNINILGEITVKWFEAVQNKLPMCYGGALFGALNLKAQDRRDLLKYHLPWALDTGRNCGFLMNVYFEERLDQPIDELHAELNIKPLILPHRRK
ncbi:ubiquinone biosynthesis protein COQ4 homolog, mitochondrial [Coccinella septempunctata]|uniref:ubiquinone biosynthesis protein COQ4 homolog, mitochondrial n=1 Tax=Coccinella septempunctata TaxID=41139 RepID=UPI001D08E60D|nr:ubiquinone biosynthesis protein COQ4 homolog, mitochondrial [Coccinella septempunctata]